MITVYLGDVTEYLAALAKSTSPDAALLDHTNFENLEPGTYYTSLGDLGSLPNLATVLLQATDIVYAPPDKWTDEVNGISMMSSLSEDYLKVFFYKCTVVDNQDSSKTRRFVNTDISKFSNILHLADLRKTDKPQLWIAGCSISHGIGVTEQTRYGTLLANQLGLEASFLTHSGSSIAWAADQILRSDIREKDIVVWGLTRSARVTRFGQNKFEFITAANCPDISTFDYMIGDNNFYQSVVALRQVVNFCEKIKATLILASLLDDQLVHYLDDYKPLVMLYRIFGRGKDDQVLDVGTDKNNIHPGPRTHQIFAEQIYKKIQELLAK